MTHNIGIGAIIKNLNLPLPSTDVTMTVPQFVNSSEQDDAVKTPVPGDFYEQCTFVVTELRDFG